MSNQISEEIFLTTPLYYVNAKPHLGHAYTTILADILSRFYRQQGKHVTFLTGTDEHGEKIQTKAKEAGQDPKTFADQIAGAFAATWKEIGLEPDIFYRTTQPKHYALVQNALAYLKEKGEIYFGEYEGKYCVGCERFRTDQEWNEKGLCPDHLTPPEIRKEANYFFKMSAYQERLIAFYKQHPESIQPAHYLKEVQSFLAQPLEDLNISRPVERISWGIPLPFDAKYVTYVWFDALLNYPGGIGYEGKAPGQNAHFSSEKWKSVRHLIGKDILKTHAIYWPTMLMALGLPVFHHLQVGGFWLSSGIKMSKSLGNVVDPLLVKEKFGIESLRYYLMRDNSYGSDSSFSWESYINRANAELANGIGNLASRTLTIAHKNLGAKVPAKNNRSGEDQALLAEIHKLPALFLKEFNEFRYHMALAAFGESVAKVDKYINDMKPWALAKDPAQLTRLEAVLGTAMDALWTLSVVIESVLPEGAQKLRVALGQKIEKNPEWSQALLTLTEGMPIGEIPRLYPRLELPKEENEAKK